MNCYPATPAEFDELMTQLEPVSEARRPAIARMMFEEVGACPVCDESVRRSDRRILTDAGLTHWTCTGREVERELTGEELQEAKEAPMRELRGVMAEIRKSRRKS